MKRAKLALLLALAAVSASPTLLRAQESVDAPAERVAAFAEATYRLRPRLTADGSLVGDIGTMVGGGTVRTIPNLPVSLVSQGKIVARVMTNTEGEFAFPQVAPGAYTVVASNAKILHVASMVVGPYAEGEVAPLHLIAASPLSAERRKAMMVAVVGRARQAAAFQANPVFEPMVATYRSTISPEGNVVGKVCESGVDLTGMVVRAFREGEPVGEAEVESDGMFTLTGMTPGPVSIVAFGPQGMNAFAIELVAAQPVAALNGDSNVLVSIVQDPSGTLEFDLSSTSDVQAGASVPGDSFSTPEGDALAGTGSMDGSTAAGSGSFSTGGGGGGGGAGGGIGALGALGAAAAAVAGSNGGGGFVPSPSTAGGGT